MVSWIVCDHVGRRLRTCHEFWSARCDFRRAAPRPVPARLGHRGGCRRRARRGPRHGGSRSRPARVACHGVRAWPGAGLCRSSQLPTGNPDVAASGARIVRCFASVAQAAGDGFAVAAPPGTLIVGGVFLLPTGSLTVRQCRAAARAAGFAVPCPAVAPALSSTPLQLPNCDDDGGCSPGGSGFTFLEQGLACRRITLRSR